VHHQSETYTLSCALRQSAGHSLVSWAYYIPLSLFFPPLLYYYHAQFNLLYQFYLHTEMIPKLPSWVRWVFNTPALHAVHHGRNEYCIDKNYGGTLIVFDRLFGTYQEPIEEVAVVYGLTHSINTMCPVRANTGVWLAIWQQIKETDGWLDKFLVLYNGPGWVVGTHSPEQEWPIPPCTRGTVQPYDPRYSTSLNAYFFFQFAVYLGFHSFAMTLTPTSTKHAFDFWLLSVYLLLQPYTIGLLMDRAPSAFTWELGRIGFGVLLGVHFFAAACPLALVAVVIFAFVSLVWLSQSLAELAVPIGPHEIGKDFDNTKEAEQLLWQQYNDKIKAD
jgi:alkylglycerol monooxygenase